MKIYKKERFGFIRLCMEMTVPLNENTAAIRKNIKIFKE